jgi:hypothetical protein
MDMFTHKMMPDGLLLDLETGKRYVVVGLQLKDWYGGKRNRAIFNIGSRVLKINRGDIDESEYNLESGKLITLKRAATASDVAPPPAVEPAAAASRPLPEFNKNLIDLATELERRAGMLRTIASDLEGLMPEAFAARR